jgi:arylsulfatase A-like enzyme/Flp pilus assembly protein TadD
VLIAAAAALTIAAVAAAVLRLSRGLPSAAVGAVAPNLLLITIDTLRWDHVGCYGAKDAATPVLDRLAARGVRFETAIMHTPLTAPSHASILTATAGFISGFPLDRRFGYANGFETYDDRLPRGEGTGRAAQTERRADATTKSVLEWFDTRGSQPSQTARRGTRAPWFLWVHYFDPHAAYEPPPEFLARFAARPYDGEIAFVDAQIGRLLDRLEQLGQLRDTLILVTADHGESLGEHGEDTHGVFVYDATLRVPWILAGPGVSKGHLSTVVARGIDAMPTLLDLAGVSVPAGLDGRSLKPLVQEGRTMSDEPAYVESLLAKQHLGWAAVHGLRYAGWKFIQLPRPELYDLALDAAERTNRVNEEPDRSASMARQLHAQLSAARTAVSEPGHDRGTTERLRALGYLGGAPSSSQSASARDPKDGIALINRLERAIAAIRTDPRRAADELRAVLSEDAESELARRQLALALSALSDHAGVIAEVRILQSRGAATAEDLVLLSESLRVRGRADEAARVLDEAAQLDPRSPEAALTKARRLASERMVEEAAAAYRRALDLAPDHPEALVGLGNLALAQGDVATAGAYFARVLARDPGDTAARTGLGVVRGREGRMSEAIELLTQVVREAPDNAEALAGLAAALARTGAPAAAVPYFERAVAAGLRTPAVLNGLGFAKLETGDRAGALIALRASLAMRSDQPGVQKAVRDLTARQ